MARSPRITTSVSPETYQLLAEFADLTDSSLSGCVSQLLEDSAPHLRKIVEALHAVEAVSGERAAMLAIKADMGVQALHGVLGAVTDDD